MSVAIIKTSLVLGLLLLSPASVYSLDFSVNSESDGVDGIPGDGVCLSRSGQCTLRAAVQESNASSGADVINVPAGKYVLSLGSNDEDEAAEGDLDI